MSEPLLTLWLIVVIDVGLVVAVMSEVMIRPVELVAAAEARWTFP